MTFLEFYPTGMAVIVGIMTLMEKTLATTKPGYKKYAVTRSACIPWFPRKIR
jgi:steroid 5-alpha reductase family enzyme